MALLSVIRRWAFREGMSIREITRRTGLSRNTIRNESGKGTYIITTSRITSAFRLAWARHGGALPCPAYQPEHFA